MTIQCSARADHHAFTSNLQLSSPASFFDSAISFETGRIATLAEGAVVAQQGSTVVLTTAVADRTAPDDTGFLPLTVDYRHKVSAQLASMHPIVVII